MNVYADEWTIEMSTIASNDLFTLYDIIGRIIGRIMKKGSLTTGLETW